MSKEGMTLTVLATGLADAVSKDEQPNQGGFDLGAGMFGDHMSEWLRDLSREISTINSANEYAMLLKRFIFANRNSKDTSIRNVRSEAIALLTLNGEIHVLREDDS